MECKWLLLLVCIGILADSNSAVWALTVSRKFNNRLLELLESISPDTRSDDSWDADPHVKALDSSDRHEIGDANPMCHVVTLKRRLDALANVAGNCMRDIIFKDCCQPHFLALKNTGIYPIEHGRNGYAYCDQSTDGGGWLVVARRAGGKRNFNKSWKHYKKGFGPLDKDFWIGLDSMVYLTAFFLHTELRFDMMDENGTWYHAYYNQIVVDPESTNYTLTVRGYDPEKSTIWDALSFHDQQPFSTKDRVNVNFDSRVNCVYHLNRTGAGWWWGSRESSVRCFMVNMNQEYYVVDSREGNLFARGIGWCDSKNLSRPCLTFKVMEMKIRPKQWHCGNLPRIPWETVQHQFLYRADESEEDDELPQTTMVMPDEKPTTSEPISEEAVTIGDEKEPAPITSPNQVAPTTTEEGA